jgi:hypothetical protein
MRERNSSALEVCPFPPQGSLWGETMVCSMTCPRLETRFVPQFAFFISFFVFFRFSSKKTGGRCLGSCGAKFAVLIVCRPGRPALGIFWWGLIKLGPETSKDWCQTTLPKSKSHFFGGFFGVFLGFFGPSVARIEASPRGDQVEVSGWIHSKGPVVGSRFRVSDRQKDAN